METYGWDKAVSFVREKLENQFYIKCNAINIGTTSTKPLAEWGYHDIYDNTWGVTNITATNDKYCTYINYNNGWNGWKIFGDSHHAVPLNPLTRLQEMLDARQGPRIIVSDSRKPMPAAADVREERARETLRRVIGQEKFLLFLKNGFISVRGKDDYIYQLFPGHGITCVFDRGNLIARLCLYFPGDFTPTDSLIMRFLLTQ